MPGGRGRGRGGSGGGGGGGGGRRAVVFNRREEWKSRSGARRNPPSTLPSRAARAPGRSSTDAPGASAVDVRAIMIASFPGFWGTPVTRAARSASARATPWDPRVKGDASAER